MSNELRIKAFQHLGFEALKNGVKIPKIYSEVCMGQRNQVILEGSLLLEEALERLIGYRTRGPTDAVTSLDRQILLDEIDSLLELIQAKRRKIVSLPEFKESPPVIRKKIKP